MPLTLMQLMRKRVLEPGGPLVRVPVLFWEAPPRESSSDEDWVPTETGSRSRPSSSDPLVFPVEKVPGRANPFGMGVTVGRIETNDIIVDDGSVSRFHAWLQCDARTRQWFVCDAESKNGTFLAGNRLAANQKVPLADRAQLRFGEVPMTFLLPDTLVALVQQRDADGFGRPVRQASKR